MKRSGLAVAIAILMVAPPPMSRAEGASVEPGARIRLTTVPPPAVIQGRIVHRDEETVTFVPLGEDTARTMTWGGKTLTGEVVQLDDERIVLARDGKPLIIPLDDVSGIEVSRGRSSGMGKGFLIAAGVGGAIGGLLGATCEGSCWWGPGAAALTFGVAGGALGALTGAAGENWQKVELNRRTAFELTLPEKGIGAQVSLSF